MLISICFIIIGQKINLSNMDGLSQSLSVLSAMITPTVLILASGSLILTTSQRLGRVVERTRKIADKFKELAPLGLTDQAVLDERGSLFKQLGMATRRAKLLQRAMVSLYLTLSIFVFTSVAIGVLDVSELKLTWIPLMLGFSGAALLFYASLLLIAESRIALGAVNYEMDFALSLSRQFISEDMLKAYQLEKEGKKWYWNSGKKANEEKH